MAIFTNTGPVQQMFAGLDDGAFSFINPGYNVLNWYQKKVPLYPQGLAMVFMPGFAQNADGTARWFSTVRVRTVTRTSTSTGKTYGQRVAVLPENDPISHFTNKVKILHAPWLAAYMEGIVPNKFGKRNVPWGDSTSRRVLLSVVKYDELRAHIIEAGPMPRPLVLEIPAQGGASKIQAYMETLMPAPINAYPPILFDPNGATPVIIKFDREANQDQWQFTYLNNPQYLVRLPDQLIDSANLPDLDKAVKYLPSSELIAMLSESVPAEVLNDCMSDYPGWVNIQSRQPSASSAQAPILATSGYAQADLPQMQRAVHVAPPAAFPADDLAHPNPPLGSFPAPVTVPAAQAPAATPVAPIVPPPPGHASMFNPSATPAPAGRPTGLAAGQAAEALRAFAPATPPPPMPAIDPINLPPLAA